MRGCTNLKANEGGAADAGLAHLFSKAIGPAPLTFFVRR